ncbi:MAG: multidrug efflux SMR transporter [Bacteroidales bacterium]
MILFIAGLCETAFAFCLGKAKITSGNEAMLWYSGFSIALVLSMWFLIIAVRNIPIGTAYAVWTGIGVVGTVLVSTLFFKEPITTLKLIFITTLIASIIGLKLTNE